MKRLFLLVLLLAAPAFAQTATLTTPETVTATGAQFVGATFDRSSATITVQYVTAGAVVKRTQTYTTANSTEWLSFLTAIGTTRATETGSIARKMQFRVLGWMLDNGAFRDEAGQSIAVTVAP